MKRAQNALTAAMAMVPWLPLAAYAADSAPGAVSALGEVTVTAQRRAENIQDVPASMAAISGEELERAQTVDVRQMLTTTPNISYTQFRSNEPTVYIRGIGPFLNTVGLERPVGFYVDDVYVGGSGVAGLGTLFGMDRLEVLRGPQGTLFGRNVTSGVIHYITKDPTAEADGKIALTAGNYSALQGQLYANGGLSERVSANVSLSYNKRDGFARNLSSGDELDDDDAFGARAKVRVEVSDSTYLLFAADYFNRDAAGGSRASARINGNGSPSPGGRSAVQPTGANAYGPGATELQAKGFSARIKSELDFANLTAIAAYREYFARDFSVQQVRQDADPRFNIPASGIRVTGDNFVDQNQTTVEVRLDRSGGAVDWVGGVFYVQEDVDGRTDFKRTNDFGATLAARTLSVAPVKAKSYAAFGDAIWNVNEQWSIGGGLRYTNDEKKVRFAPRNLLTNATFFTLDGEKSWSEVTYRGLAQWKPTDGVMAYATYSRGFKSGGYDTEATTLAGTVPLDPETVDAVELGVKTELLDRRLRVNVAVFDMKLKGYQITALNPTTLNTISFNAGDLRSKGAELEVAALLTEGLQFTFGYGYTDAKYVSNIVSAGVNINGLRVQRTPKNSWNAALSYTVPTSAGAFDALVDYTDVDRMEGNERNQIQNQHPAFNLLNASVGWESNDAAWSVRLWGRNLTDELIVRQITSVSVNQVGAIYDAPRTYGVTVTRSFGGRR